MQRKTIVGILSLTRPLGGGAARRGLPRLPDPYAGRGGVSWLYRWAAGRDVKIDWKREPEPPDSIQRLYDQLTRPPG